MPTTTRLLKVRAALALAVLSASAGGHAQAGWPLHKSTQVVYVTQPQAVIAGQAPVTYTAQAPITYAAQAPVAYTAQAPVTYTAQAPVAYTAQAPVTYTVTNGSAPVVAGTTGSAPGVGNAPGGEGIRYSDVFRRALIADLIAYTHSDESGKTRLEKMAAVRDRAHEEIEKYLANEDDSQLNTAEENDLKTIVDNVMLGTGGGIQRTYTQPLSPAGTMAGIPGATMAGAPGVGIVGGGVTLYQPTTYYVPVLLQPAPPRHHHKLHRAY